MNYAAKVPAVSADYLAHEDLRTMRRRPRRRREILFGLRNADRGTAKADIASRPILYICRHGDRRASRDFSHLSQRRDSERWRNTGWSSASGSGVTMHDFLSVHSGMSLSEVTAILGTGRELSRSDIAGYNTVMYGWKNRNGSNMNVMLQNGAVVSKAQFGLRWRAEWRSTDLWARYIPDRSALNAARNYT
jgi:hypothetical protein